MSRPPTTTMYRVRIVKTPDGSLGGPLHAETYSQEITLSPPPGWDMLLWSYPDLDRARANGWELTPEESLRAELIRQEQTAREASERAALIRSALPRRRAKGRAT